MRGSPYCLLQLIGTYQGSRAIELIFVKHLLRDIYPTVFHVQFLFRALLREDMRKILPCQWLFRLRMDRRQWFVRHIRKDIIPLCRNLTLWENKFLLFCHFSLNIYVLLIGFFLFIQFHVDGVIRLVLRHYLLHLPDRLHLIILFGNIH